MACMPYREWVRRLRASPPKRICCFMVRVPQGSNRIQGCGASFAPNWRALLGSSPPSEAPLHARFDRLDRRKPIQALTIEVPVAMTLKQLHGIIQAAMDWEDAHLWEFTL